MLTARAHGVEDQASAIVVSFEANWLRPIQEKRITRVIRKRVPKKNPPQFLYIYVNSPVGALIARAKISKLSTITLSAAIRHTKSLCLSPNEIAAYVGHAKEIGMYEFKSIRLAGKPITLKELRELMIFHAPQSFFFLSQEGKSVIDREASFDLSRGKNS